MRILDVAVSLVFCLFAYHLVFGGEAIRPHYEIAIIISVLLQMLVFHAYSLYRAWRGVDYLQEMTVVIFAWFTVFAIQVFLAAITKTTESYSRAWLLMWFTFGGTEIILVRHLLRVSLKHIRAKGYNLRHIVIIASGDIGPRAYQAIMATPTSGFNVIGYFTDDRTPEIDPARTHVGRLEEISEFIGSRQVDQVWLAAPLSEASLIERMIGELQHTALDIRLVPDIFGLRLINHSVSNIAGLSVINISVSPMEGISLWIKTLEDKVVSTLLLLLVSPLMLVIALTVKLSSPGPVFYRQTRLSWNLREFEMYKFRTMPLGTEDASGPVRATAGEDRATRVGKFLRRTSLDELPQFWNVIKGDMSIVGPRPERPAFVGQLKREVPSYMQKHMVKAGITGWAQVNGWRGDTNMHQRIEHDLYYIDNWSLWLDLKIIIMTLFTGFVHKHAY
jgi:putative colanic acid biosynthesis UDP-glucose lipid carrier transferase